MSATMAALVYEAPRTMVMRELPVPRPAEGEVRVRVAYSGICGSELSGFLGQSSIRTPPLVFGHEVSGWVDAVGPATDPPPGVEPGRPVTVNPLVSCGRCRACARGREQLCARRLLLGASLPGCNAQYVCVPAGNVLALDDGDDLRRAALVEPTAFAVHAVRVAEAAPTDTALVVGAGPIGLLVLEVLAAHGVRGRYVVEPNEDRAAAAVRRGAVRVTPTGEGLPAAVAALTAGEGVDLVVDAVGSAGTRQDALACVTPGGTVLLAGLHTDATTLPLNTVVRNETTLRGVFAYTPRDVEVALTWLRDLRVVLDRGIVVADLADGPGWYQRLVDGDPATKVLLTPPGALP